MCYRFLLVIYWIALHFYLIRRLWWFWNIIYFVHFSTFKYLFYEFVQEAFEFIPHNYSLSHIWKHKCYWTIFCHLPIAFSNQIWNIFLSYFLTWCSLSVMRGHNLFVCGQIYLTAPTAEALWISHITDKLWQRRQWSSSCECKTSTASTTLISSLTS